VELIDEPEPRDLAHVVLEVHQELGEPRGVVPNVQPPDQRRPVCIRPLEDPKQLPRSGLAECGDDALADVLSHVARLEGTVPASTTTLTLCYYVRSGRWASDVESEQNERPNEVEEPNARREGSSDCKQHHDHHEPHGGTQQERKGEQCHWRHPATIFRPRRDA
jgi:hypothetical protein